jgi:hypothetical protein
MLNVAVPSLQQHLRGEKKRPKRKGIGKTVVKAVIPKVDKNKAYDEAEKTFNNEDYSFENRNAAFFSPSQKIGALADRLASQAEKTFRR